MSTDAEHNRYRELLGAYALDALPGDERAELEAHLAGCDACRAELAELRLAVLALPLAAEEREPPATLRARLRAATRQDLIADDAHASDEPIPPLPAENVVPLSSRKVGQSSGSRWRVIAPWAAAAVFLLFGLAMLGWALSLQANSSQQQVIALKGSPAAPTAGGQLVYLKDRQVMILTPRNLPALGPGQVYEVWLIQGSAALPSGVFSGGQSQVAISGDLSHYQALAITIERGPLGTAAPTGEKVIVTPL